MNPDRCCRSHNCAPCFKVPLSTPRNSFPVYLLRCEVINGVVDRAQLCLLTKKNKKIGDIWLLQSSLLCNKEQKSAKTGVCSMNGPTHLLVQLELGF